MDERPQHGYPLASHDDGTGGHGGTPWPSMPHAVPGAPHVAQPMQQYAQPQSVVYAQQHVAAHAQPQPQPHAPSHQFQYAGGFVTPGAGTGHPTPMAAHGGTIGMPQQPGVQPSPMHAAPMPHLHASVAPALQHEGQPQAWAYPTPNGLQLVQPGETAVMAAQQSSSTRGVRVRWETIVPAAAVACLVAAIGLLIHDFSRITGRDGAAVTQASAAKRITDDADTGAGGADARSSAGASDADAAEPAASAGTVLAQAQQLFEQGRFADAANMLHPLLDAESPDQRVVALHDRVDAAASRNTALLKRLAGERRAGKWSKVIVTVRQLEQLRPLSADLKRMRSTARAQIKKAQAAREAKRRAAQARAARPASTGGGAGRPTPAPGATSNTSTSARPPASSPSAPASIPPRPDAPNPTGPQGGGAAAVGGGPVAGSGSGGQNCHTHDGVTECH